MVRLERAGGGHRGRAVLAAVDARVGLERGRVDRLPIFVVEERIVLDDLGGSDNQLASHGLHVPNSNRLVP